MCSKSDGMDDIGASFSAAGLLPRTAIVWNGLAASLALFVADFCGVLGDALAGDRLIVLVRVRDETLADIGERRADGATKSLTLTPRGAYGVCFLYNACSDFQNCLM